MYIYTHAYTYYILWTSSRSAWCNMLRCRITLEPYMCCTRTYIYLASMSNCAFGLCQMCMLHHGGSTFFLFSFNPTLIYVSDVSWFFLGKQTQFAFFLHTQPIFFPSRCGFLNTAANPMAVYTQQYIILLLIFFSFYSPLYTSILLYLLGCYSFPFRKKLRDDKLLEPPKSRVTQHFCAKEKKNEYNFGHAKIWPCKWSPLRYL